MQMDPLNTVQSFFTAVYNMPATEQKERRTTNYFINHSRSISITLDPHGGCLVNVPAGCDLPVNFQQQFDILSASLAKTGTINSIWLSLFNPCTANVFSAIPANWVIGDPLKGNLVLDYQKKCTRVWQWINPSKQCNIPPGATHNLGASAAVVDDLSERILLVQGNNRSDRWEMPGGSYDPFIDSVDSSKFTAIRECKEETGVDVGSRMGVLIGQIHFPCNQFAPGINQMWRFNVDHRTHVPTPQLGEVLRAQWISYADVRKGEFEGLKIGPDVQAAIAAKTGFTESSKSSQWMKLVV